MNQYQQNAQLFKSFCDENRLRIIELLRSTDEICGCVLLEDLSISQSTLSYHMKILVENGVVTSRRTGKLTMYSLSRGSIEQSIQILDRLLPSDDLISSTIENCSCATTKLMVNER